VIVVGLITFMKAFSKLVELLEKRFGVVLGDLGNTVVKGVDDEG
jgi:hypothetical protein